MYPVGHGHLAEEVLASLGKDILASTCYHSFQVIVHKACPEN